MAYAAGALRGYFLNRRCSALVAAVCVALCGAVQGVAAQTVSGVVDVNDIGNEAVPLLEAMAGFLNTHTCITQDELNAFVRAVNAMQQRLGIDYGDVSSSARLNAGGNLNVTQAGWERAKIRVNNYQRELSDHLQDLERLPRCTQAAGLHVGGYALKNWGHVRTIERSADTGEITNQFSDSGDPLGAGVLVGYSIRPWSGIVVGPFASFDYYNQTIKHVFPNGNYLGTTAHWGVTVGAKAGYDITSDLMLYGLAGASWLNQNLKIDFGGPVTSQNTTTPGFTLGFGGEYQPSMLQGFGLPISLFAQYQHTWWADAHLDQPAASPFFNYSFRRNDDTIKFGVNVYFTPQSAPVPGRRLVTK